MAASNQAKKRWILSTIFDHLLLVGVVAPLVSAYWCGMFFLVDFYVFPEDFLFSIWFTCIAGYTAVFFCHVVHERLTKWARYTDALYNPLARLYSILLIIVIVFQWRGFWYILDHYLEPGYLWGVICIAGGLFLMACSGCSKSITGVVPFILIADDKTNYFIALSKFSHLSARNPVLHVADHLYSVLYIHPTTIIIWRGIWHLQDYAIFPKNQLKSGLVSLGIGVAGTVLCYLLQWPLNSCVKGLPRVPRFLTEQLWRASVVSIAIFYWRGSWVFWEMAFQKDLFTMWFVAITCAFLLCILNCWSIATLRGVWVDDPLDSQEDSILLDIHYCSAIAYSIREHRLKKVRTVENEIYSPVKSALQTPIVQNGFQDPECPVDFDEKAKLAEENVDSLENGHSAQGHDSPQEKDTLIMSPDQKDYPENWTDSPETRI